MKNDIRLRAHTFIALLTVSVACFVALPVENASGQVIDDEDKVELVLSDGTNVTLYGEAHGRRATFARLGANSARDYYYLPFNLHLSLRPDGVPEFLFLKYTTEQRESQGGISGALMHFLMQWGPTPDQAAEMETLLKQARGNGARVAGPVTLEEPENGGSFSIISATLGDDGLTRSLVTSGRAPLVPGGKVAAASQLSANGAQLLAATFEETRSITDVSIALDFQYTTLMPAVNGYVHIYWSKIESFMDSLRAAYTDKVTGTTTEEDCFWFICVSDEELQHTYTYDEYRKQTQSVVESNFVTFDFRENLVDERVDAIREKFFDYLLGILTEPAPPAPPKKGEEDDFQPGGAPGDIRQGENYTYTRKWEKIARQHSVQTINLNYRLPIKRRTQIVGNLASWYDGVRDNPSCVASVNLNDPFFQHRDIRFILDLEAKEMFDDAVNYVTVSVRKQRDKGNDFSDRVTIDKAFLSDHGVAASMTYARGEDSNPDVYEYQSQWSLRGGKVYPENPPWTTGSWEGVTLGAPVTVRTIELEADLEELVQSDITRVTAQIHYKQFGKEVEENIHVSPARGEPLVEQKIFLDKDAPGYAYRLVFNHKKEGKLALPWNAQITDDYIYATIPETFFDEKSDMLEMAKEAGKKVVDSAAEKVLEKFDQLMGGGSK